MRTPSANYTQRKKLTRLHMRRPRNQGPLPEASGRGISTNPFDHAMWIVMAIRLRRDRIVQARFVASPHPKLKACASLLTELITGQDVGYAASIHPYPFSQMLCLRVNDLRFVFMVVRAMYEAIYDARQRSMDSRPST